ncbi:MAG: tyrosine recombinase XerC [Candidatus Parcubacteria bacterium]|nr:MAG: tyrosine recombinase XerC [Candidatus Parcubacteria bacterium]
MPRETTQLAKLKQAFLEHLELERGRAVPTIAAYDRYLSRFFAFSGARTPADITEQSIRDFRVWLNRQPGRERGATVKRRTQNYYLIALRAFLKFLRRRGISALSPERIDLAKVGERDIEVLSVAELERLLAAPEGSDIRSLRDKALLELLFSTGLRVGELTRLNRDDIDLSRDEFSVRGKGDKVRVVFLTPAAKEALRAYLDARGDVSEALFVQHGPRARGGRETRLTSRSVERLIKHYAAKAGIVRRVTPHMIRHSFATDLLMNGADIRAVQALLGHAHLVTTQIYTHVTDRHLREVHKQFHSRNRARKM